MRQSAKSWRSVYHGLISRFQFGLVKYGLFFATRGLNRPGLILLKAYSERLRKPMPKVRFQPADNSTYRVSALQFVQHPTI